jgi:hypothetical protein
MSDRKSLSQIAREKQAEKSFAQTQAQDRRSNGVLTLETKRMRANALKTAKLRALREAKDAGERAANKHVSD